MQAPLKEIDEVMENIEDIQNDIQTLKETTADLFAEQKTFDERMADGITRLLEKFKQREQELLEQVQSASANSPSAAAATQNEQLSAEITRLKARLEALDAAFKLSETNVRTQEVRIKELEAEVARLQVHNSEGTDQEEDEDAYRSANTSESESDTGNEDTTSQVSLQDTDAQTKNSTTPVAGGGGMFSVASQAASAAASVASHIGGLISGSSGAVTPRPQPPDTSIVPVPVNDQTQDTVPSSAVQVPQDQISASQVDESQVVAPEPVSNDASAAGAETQPVLSTLNSEEDVLDAILTYVHQETMPSGVVKYVYFDGKNASNLKRIGISPANRKNIIKYFQTENLRTRLQKTIPGVEIPGVELTTDMLKKFENDYPVRSQN